MPLSDRRTWRRCITLPPALENERGFVSLAVVADFNGIGDGLRQTEAEIERWREALEELA